MFKKLMSFAALIVVLGAGCGSELLSPTSSADLVEEDTPPSEPLVVLPLDGLVAGYNPSYKRFGEYFADRFTGYHVGEDVEVAPEDLGPNEVQEVPVRAIADGEVRYVDDVSGYGGVVVIAHDTPQGKTNAIYGHIDLGSVVSKVGDRVFKGEFLANLGADQSAETDGERQHLHFALYRGDELRLAGYEQKSEAVSQWINPQDFFAEQGVAMPDGGLPQFYSAIVDPQGKKIFNLDFTLPPGWDVEYVPQIQALNLYITRGSGIARERSQIFIRYFDADQFLTLPTVTIHDATDLTIGPENYVARRYDIEKRASVPDSPHQPDWRNVRHIVTDFRANAGRARYYVIAKSPALSEADYQAFLTSVKILR